MRRRGTATVRIDRTPPRISFANSQDPLEPESIRARVADPLSGPDPSRGWIGIRRAGSGDAFAPLPATPAGGGELRAHWDSDAYPPVATNSRRVGYDLAGNAAGSHRDRADGAAMVLSNPAEDPDRVSVAFFGGSGPAARRTAPYGRRVLLSGHLRDGDRLAARGPQAGAGDRELRGRRRHADLDRLDATRVAPSPSGSPAVRAARSGSAFAGSPTLTRSSSRPLDLRVRSVVRLHASASVARIGGGPLVFSGQVDAAPGTIPAAGKSVELQFRLAGLPWSEFRTVQTDRHGRFRYAYRFSDDDSRGARFQFRACAPAQDGWPYEPGSSLPVLVRGL